MNYVNEFPLSAFKKTSDRECETTLVKFPNMNLPK